MRWLDAASFFCSWKKGLGWKRKSPVVVLAENAWDWNQLLERLPDEFGWYYEFYVLELSCVWFDGIEDPVIKGMLEQLERLEPEAVIGVGSFPLLQRVCLLRELLSREMPLLLLSGKDRVAALFREDLWIRDSRGRTCYRGKVLAGEKDCLVVLPEGIPFFPRSIDYVKGKELFDSFETEIYRWRRALQRVFRTEEFLEAAPEIERDLCEELAEPLTILYGMPLEIGCYFALVCLYGLLGEQERQRICLLLGADPAAGVWVLEQLAEQYRKEEIGNILLPREDISLLTEMTMEGMEGYPGQQRLTLEEIEAFYRQLCG